MSCHVCLTKRLQRMNCTMAVSGLDNLAAAPDDPTINACLHIGFCLVLSMPTGTYVRTSLILNRIATNVNILPLETMFNPTFSQSLVACPQTSSLGSYWTNHPRTSFLGSSLVGMLFVFQNNLGWCIIATIVDASSRNKL